MWDSWPILQISPIEGFTVGRWTAKDKLYQAILSQNPESLWGCSGEVLTQNHSKPPNGIAQNHCPNKNEWFKIQYDQWYPSFCAVAKERIWTGINHRCSACDCQAIPPKTGPASWWILVGPQTNTLKLLWFLNILMNLMNHYYKVQTSLYI